MPSYNKGPCCCGSPPGVCCFPSNCLDLIVVFEDTETALDGEYVARFDSGGSQGEGWYFYDAGSCGGVVNSPNPNTANGGFVSLMSLDNSFFVNITDTPCAVDDEGFSYVTAVTWETANWCIGGPSIEPNPGTITIKWRCLYPEYFTLNSDLITNTDCEGCIKNDCPCNVINSEAPIDCDNSSPIGILTYNSGILNAGPCGYSFIVSYNCNARTLHVLITYGECEDTAEYEITDISLTDFSSEVPITLNPDFIPDPAFSCCLYPSTLTIEGHNLGTWCQ